METELQIRPTLTVCETFKWRQRQGPPIAPADMETRHLFFTLRMIWNHSMPPEARFVGYRRYRFDPRTHNQAYMKVALKMVAKELFTRDDIEERWRRDLDTMAAWFRKHLAQDLKSGKAVADATAGLISA